MVNKVDGCRGFLIDGFPLDLAQAEKFEKQLVPVTRLVQITNNN
jgi:adenylate kinase family enzyme